MKETETCSGTHDDTYSSRMTEEDVCPLAVSTGFPVDHETDGFLCMSLQGQILDVNHSYCQLSRYTREELLGMNIKDLDAVECNDAMAGNLLDIVKRNNGRFEVTHRAKDCSFIELEVSATCLEHPEPVIIFIVKHIAGQNQTDRFFTNKGETYVSLFKYNKAVMLVIDPATFDIVDANIAACNYYGWPLEEITRMRIDEINTLSSEAILAEMQNAVNEKRNYFLFKHRLANGTIRDVEVYSGPVTVNSRNLLYSIIHDITERKKAEDELKTRDMQLRTAQKIGHIGSWELDISSGQVSASDEAKRIYGLELENLTLSDIQKIPLPEYRPMMNEALKSLIEEGTSYNIQFRVKRLNDGAIRDIHSIAEYSAGKNIVIGTIEDITERKKAEDALLHGKMIAEAANKSKDEFLATMSHELRTPLTSVIGFSDVLLDDTFSRLDERQARYVSHILDAGKHLLNLINDVLDISKVEAGKMELYYEDFSVQDAVNDVREMLFPFAKNKYISIDTEMDSDVGVVNADRTKFMQILYNLGSNAIKFTPEKGSVFIRAKCSDEVILVSVQDNGVGISNEDIEKLFHPFTQLNSYLLDENKGTGLGLALVKKFVELHEGRIWVESKVSEGSTFTFLIPVKRKSEKTDLQ